VNQILIISLIFLILIGACGEKSQNKSYEVITPSDRIFTFEDLESVGFKKSKEYNVDGLEGAKGALYGFWATDKGQKEYELRFYPSHAIAVSLGEPLAQEATGEDAIIKKSDATWKEGIKDRRRSQRTSGSHPKYGNYSIYGNIVMLCEGQVGISLEVCWKLISTLEELE